MVVLVVLATLNYALAVALTTMAATVATIVAVSFEAGDLIPVGVVSLRAIGLFLAVVIVGSVLVALMLAALRFPFMRRRLEARVLLEADASVADPGEYPRVRNLLDGLAIAGGVPPPRFAVVNQEAPNSFGVGTRPARTIVGVTTGLLDQLSRDELEAILAYEISRIANLDVALASWTVALTAGAVQVRDGHGGWFRSSVGWLPSRIGEWIQLWAQGDQVRRRDLAAIRFTRNPQALVRALEKLDRDTSVVRRVSRFTAPLWVEYPSGASRGSAGARRVADVMALDDRITELRRVVGMPVAAR